MQSLMRKGGKLVTTEQKARYTQQKREYRQINLEKMRQYDRDRYADDIDGRRLRGRANYAKHKDRELRRKREYYATKEGLAVSKLWYKNNRHRQKSYTQNHLSQPKYKIKNAMTTRIYYALKNNRTSSWDHCLDYTLDELQAHLESLFKAGMAWNNYGFYGWHIDHKIPVSYFNFSSSDDEEFKQCWALDNLQPLWAKENLTKQNKLIYLEGGTLN